MDKKRIHEMLEKMTEWSLSEMQSKGKEGVDTKEMGEVIDMVKDLAEAEKAVWEKCYYESIVEAMEEYEEDGRAGYDRWRTSRGRFAPKGTGHETSMAMATGRAGFVPMPPYYDDDRDMWREPWMHTMGYAGDRWHDGEHATRRPDGGHDVRTDGQPRMGYTPTDGRMPHHETTYDKYQEAKRHYHETGSPEHQQQMSDHAKEYVGETIHTMRDLFADADPQLQQKIKSDLSNLCREFGIK